MSSGWKSRRCRWVTGVQGGRPYVHCLLCDNPEAHVRRRVTAEAAGLSPERECAVMERRLDTQHTSLGSATEDLPGCQPRERCCGRHYRCVH